MKLTYTVFKRSGRKFYEVQWLNPFTGQKETRSTKETVKRQAENFASDLIKSIELRGNPNNRTAWTVFVEAHAAEVQPGIPKKTAALYRTALQSIANAVSPKSLSDIDARAISQYQAALRTAGRSPQTIRCYLAHIRMAMKWAKSQGMLAAVPEFPAAKRTKGVTRAKGRAISAEEFERILAKISKVVPDETAAATFERFLRGLWLSGLRLGEAFELRWTGTGGIRVDLDRKRPAFIISSEDEKGRRDRIVPLTPDFAAFLQETPEHDRKGKVFHVSGVRREIHDLQYLSAVIAEIGKTANVKVLDEKGKVKFASAHDFRRSFGTRWATRISQRDLQIIMRHADITTTQRFYLFEDADELADRLAAASGANVANTLANSGPQSRNTSRLPSRKSRSRKTL